MRDAARVEAGSLAALNLLAANPPRYPVNPTDEPREPLTLYISRVPGTRDIILSTLKPQRKNVTAEDVANALYYVHLDLPSDGLLVAPPPPTTTAGAGQGLASPATTIPTVARKPVPSTAPRPADNALPPAGPPTGPPLTAFPPTGPAPPTAFPPTGPAPPVGGYPTGSYPPGAPPAPPPHREPVSPPRAPQPWVPPGFRLDEHHSFESVVAGHDALPSQQQQQPPSAQPFPATSTLPIRSRPLPGRSLPAGNVPIPPQAAPGSASIIRKPVGPRPDGAVDTSGFPARQDKALPQPPQAASTAPTAQRATQPTTLASTQPSPSNFVPFQLTLIRRDPSSNHQWNIGKVASVQAVEQQDEDPTNQTDHNADALFAAAAEQPSIRIHLETSGYAKFRGDDGGKAFARQVVMAYTKSWTAGIRKAFKRPAHSHERSSSEGGESAPGASTGPFGAHGAHGAHGPDDLEPPPRRFLRPRNNSLASSSTADSALAGLEQQPPPRRSREFARSTSPPLITRPGPGLKPKGYTFTSPWDGRCDFRTGNGGRSLKCRHILHPSTDATTGATGGGVAGYNPLVLAQSFRDGQGLAAVAAATSSVVTGVAGGGGPDGGRARAGSLTSALTGAVAVSELRFNLPHGDLIRKREGSEEAERSGRGDQLYGRFQDHLHHLQHHARHRRGSSTEEEDEDDYPEDGNDELDLTLGREKAGGGSRGKRAKLGKLIVYDDGFKMLDLVVAANMGIWWVSWERSF